MRRNDWLAACVVAMIVAAVVVAAALPAISWATGPATAGVPALPPTQLTIPTLQATVSAMAEREPGKPVKVKLSAVAPAARAGQHVPVTLSIISSTSSPMARSEPLPTQAFRTEVSLLIGPEGTASSTVDVPLTWASPVSTTRPDESAQQAARVAERILAANAAVQAVRPATRPDDAADAARLTQVARNRLLATVTSYRMVLSSSAGGATTIAGRLNMNGNTLVTTGLQTSR
ncbi:MAG: hypothetical protein PHU85_03765 [Phycisphaerae bacterium]|nr:hypothetical protein [Phycisphaerae bacterium]